MRSRIFPVADLLMAAAHADRHMEVEEIDRIESLLGRILEPEGTGPVALPSDLRQRMEDFRPEDFSMETTVGPFLPENTAFKRKLLEMVVSIHESDGELDFLEDTFVRELGFKLGLEDDEYADLCLRFLEEEEEQEQEEQEGPPASPADTFGFSGSTLGDTSTDAPDGLEDTAVINRDKTAIAASAPTPIPTEAPEAEHEWSFEAVSTGSAQPVLARAETVSYASDATWQGPPASSEPLPSLEDQALYELVFRTVDLFLAQHPALKLDDRQREEFAEGAWSAFSALVPKVRKKAAKKKATKKKTAKKKATKKTAKKTAKKKATKKAAKKKATKKTAKKKTAKKKTAKKKATKKKTAKKKTAKKKTAKKKATKKTAKKKATKKTAKKKTAKKKTAKKKATKKKTAKKKATKKKTAKKKATKKKTAKKKATKKTAKKKATKKTAKKTATKKKTAKKKTAKKKATKKKTAKKTATKKKTAKKKATKKKTAKRRR